MPRNGNADHWVQNLVCPSCKGTLTVAESALNCQSCKKTYPVISGVPCFVPGVLDEHQKAELDSVLSKHEHHNTSHSAEEEQPTPKWLVGKLDQNTVNRSTRIICLGGGRGDDVPHVKSDFKFNVDHLAHEYITLSPEMAVDQQKEGAIKHISSVTETLPFADDYADVVYARNSLDHFNNPLKTLIEISRVLKPNGKFFLSVYYNSNFVDCCETTIIDENFVNNHLKRVFNVEWMELDPVEEEGGHQPPQFSLPQRRKLEWLHAVLQKKPTYDLYAPKILAAYGELTSKFHTALYYDEILQPQEAAKHYQEAMNLKPFLESDKMRILYSKIRYLSILDHEGFKVFFEEFKRTNNDPFFWKVVILSGGAFMKGDIEREIKNRFTGEERIYLEHSLNTIAGLNFKRYVKSRKTLYKIARPFYGILKRFMKKSDVFERTSF